MTRHVIDAGDTHDRATPEASRPVPPAQRDGSGCDLYGPGHQIHYKHQGAAVHSRSLSARHAVVDGTLVTLVLDDGTELHWRHHDSDRLRRILEMLRGKCVVYPEFHALRIGPYWFNCAGEAEDWCDCRVSVARHPG